VKQTTFFLIILAILVLLGIFVFGKILAAKNLQIGLGEIALTHVTWSGVQLSVTVVVYNPNFLSVTIDKFHAGVYANDIPLTAIELPEPVKIRPGKAIEKEFIIDVNYLDAGVAFINALKERKVTWKIQGEYFFQLPFGVQYPYTFEFIK